MAIVSDSELKTYFETGKTPTQSQFADLIDSKKRADASTAINQVTGLVDALNSKANNTTVDRLLPVTLSPGTNTWLVPEGTLIDAIDVQEATSIVFKVGLTNNGSEWIEQELPGGGDVVVSYKKFNAETTIYFSGITNNSIITIYKR